MLTRGSSAISLKGSTKARSVIMDKCIYVSGTLQLKNTWTPTRPLGLNDLIRSILLLDSWRCFRMVTCAASAIGWDNFFFQHPKHPVCRCGISQDRVRSKPPRAEPSSVPPQSSIRHLSITPAFLACLSHKSLETHHSASTRLGPQMTA